MVGRGTKSQLCWGTVKTTKAKNKKTKNKTHTHTVRSLWLLKLEMVARWRNRGPRLQLLIPRAPTPKPPTPTPQLHLLLPLCCRLSLPALPQLLRSPLPCAPAAVCFERAICSSSPPSDRGGNEQCDGRRQPPLVRGHRLDSYPLTA